MEKIFYIIIAILLLILGECAFGQAPTDYIISDNSASITMGSTALYYSRTGHTGTANVGLGRNSLRFNVTGNRNTALGDNTLSFNSNGKSNTAVGANALAKNIGLYVWYPMGNYASRNYGNYNTAVGDSSLYSNEFGDYNTALGFRTLAKHVGTPWAATVTRTAMGYHNLAIGAFALANDVNGNENIALGSFALYSNIGNGIPLGYTNGDGGNRNIAIGYRSAVLNTYGNNNIAIGYMALQHNSTTNNNIAIGEQALNNLSNGGVTNPTPNGGGNNIAIGYQAGYNELGSHKLYIENSSSLIPLIGGDFASDVVGINVPVANLATNPTWKLQVGGDINATGTVRAAGVALTSDIRFKKNIVPLQNSLSNLLKLNAVSYDWKKEDFPDRSFTDKKQFGLIAQEVEKIFPELVETDASGYKSVNYIQITPILIESIKELTERIQKLETKLNN